MSKSKKSRDEVTEVFTGVTIVYAQPVNGKREFAFRDGLEAFNHAKANRPNWFRGVGKAK